MTIRITCNCGKVLQVREDYAGKRIRCPPCRAVLTVPAAAIAPAAKPATEIRSKPRPAQATDSPAPAPSPKKHAVRRRRSVAPPRRVIWPWFAAGGVVSLAVVLVMGGLVARRLMRPSTQPQSNPPEVAGIVDRRLQDEPRPREPAAPPQPKPPPPAPSPPAERSPAKPAPPIKPQLTPPTKANPPPAAKQPPAKPAPPPPAKQPPAKPAKADKPPAAPLKTAGQVRALLAKEVPFPEIKRALVTLGDVLDMFTKEFGVKFVVDEAAFQDDGINNILQQDVGANWMFAQMNRPFDLILRKVQRELPNPTGAAFMVGPGTIRITTNLALKQAGLRAEPPPRPTAAMARRARELKDRLAKRIDFPGVDDRRATLNDLLDHLAKKYNLTFDVNERAFKYEEIRGVLQTPVCEAPLPAMKNVPLSKVLETVLARIPVPSKADYRVVPQGYIEISTKLFFKAGERGPVTPPLR